MNRKMIYDNGLFSVSFSEEAKNYHIHTCEDFASKVNQEMDVMDRRNLKNVLEHERNFGFVAAYMDKDRAIESADSRKNYWLASAEEKSELLENAFRKLHESEV